MNLRLIIELAKRDITEKYSGSALGSTWNFIHPLVEILIYTLIFSNIMGAQLPNSSSTYGYTVYLVSGIMPWNAFSSTVLRTSSAYIDKKDIITKVKVELSSFPLYIAISESITFCVTVSIFLIFLSIVGFELNSMLFFIPILYFVQQMFAYALGFFFGIFTVFLRDLREMVRIVFQIWFWLTPIVYVYDILPDFVKNILVYNPAYIFIQSYQNIFVYDQMPNLESLFYLFILSCILLLFTNIIFKKLEKDVRDFI